MWIPASRTTWSCRWHECLLLRLRSPTRWFRMAPRTSIRPLWVSTRQAATSVSRCPSLGLLRSTPSGSQPLFHSNQMQQQPLCTWLLWFRASEEFKTDPSETAQTAASEKSETADIQSIQLTKSKILPIYSFRSWIAISSTTTSSITSVSSTKSTTAQISSLTSIGIGAWIVLILSSVNLSSIAVVWTIFSQFRLLIFLILTDAYLPQSVIDYITGMKFFSFNFSFLSFQTISVVKKPLQLIEFDKSNSMLESIGLNSGSTLVNSINLIATTLMMFALHAA